MTFLEWLDIWKADPQAQGPFADWLEEQGHPLADAIRNERPLLGGVFVFSGSVLRSRGLFDLDTRELAFVALKDELARGGFDITAEVFSRATPDGGIQLTQTIEPDEAHERMIKRATQAIYTFDFSEATHVRK